VSLDDVLYNVGTAIPALVVFAAASALGYRIRGSVGLAVTGAIVAGVFGFGTLIQELGGSLTQRSAASALGATVTATAVSFALVYKLVEFWLAESGKNGRFLTGVGMLASVIGGALLAIYAAMVLMGFSLRTMVSIADPLLWSFLLLIGIGYAVSEARGAEPSGGSVSSGEKPLDR
jgi:hypothetical protein